ncbi:MAG: hypothetical protein ABL921_31555 [Pirellula sp.]
MRTMHDIGHNDTHDSSMAIRSESSQERLDVLLEKNREGTLNEVGTSELETYEQFEHVIRLLKARVLQSQPS